MGAAKRPKDATRTPAAPQRLFRLGLLVEEDDAVCVRVCGMCRDRGKGTRLGVRAYGHLLG